MSTETPDHSGGLRVSRRMQGLIAKPGFLAVKDGQQLRELYREESVNLDPSKLSPFVLAVFTGHLDSVKEQFEEGTSPDLSGSETDFKTGYASWAVLGAQRIQNGPQGSLRHLEVLEFLFDKGLPPDVEDVTGFTALHHATTCPVERIDLAKCLLEHGANVNHQNRYGEICLFGAMQLNLTESVDLLLEHGADLDLPEANQVTCHGFYPKFGPKVGAVVNKWISRRAGEEPHARLEKACDCCGKKPEGTDGNLKNCSKCRVARYCSKECQAKAWPAHKKKCKPFIDEEATVTLKPVYGEYAAMIPKAELGRAIQGYPTDKKALSKNQMRGSHVPKRPDGKSVVIKVQVPFTNDPVLQRRELVVYTKTRDFACTIHRADAPEEYDRISEAVRTKSVTGAKAYFAAELESKDRLVVKISELLADQPW